MASSFHLFRRNQKLMLAILTLLAMFAFVFLDPLFRYMGNSQAPANPIMVETRYGDLKRTDIEQLIAQRQIADNFITMVVATTVDKFIDQGRFDARSRDMYIRIFANEWRQRVMQRAGSTKEAAAVETMLLAKRADQIGLLVSDSAINQLLREVSADNLTPRELGGLISKLRYGNAPVGEQQLFDSLRNEIKAWRVTQMFSASIDAIPPAQRFDYFNRLNRKAKIEAIAVPVEDFADKVPKPGDAELEAFFDEHKNQIAVPGSPVPGFKIPHRERFQYLKAEYDLFRETAEVTEEEIEKYYEENKKSMFRKLELPKDKPSAERDDSKKSEDPEPDLGPGTDDTSKPESSKPEKEPAEKPAAESPGDSAKKAPASKTGAAPKPNDGSSSDRTSGGARFLLVADEKTAKPDSSEPEAKAPATDKKEDKAAEEKPADETTAENKQTEDKSEDKTVDEKSAEEEPASKEPEYEPLEKVRDQIVTALKAQKATDKANAAIEAAASRMRAYADARTFYLVKKEADPNAVPPKDIDFVALAKEHNLTYEESRLASANELAGTDIGKSFMSVRGELPFQFRAAPFIEVAFGPRHSLYEAVTTNDTDGNAFLSWKVEQAEERVPKFEEVRAEVERTWRLIKARDLARKQAETYVAEAKGAKKKLSEVFTDEKVKVITAGSFSWMTMGSTPEAGRDAVVMLSEVPGIDHPGESFMETVFSLPLDGIGVAMNEPQNTCYTVQVIEYDPPVVELEEDFAREDFRRYINVAMGDTRQIYLAWVNSIGKQAGLKWLQEPSATEEVE